MRKRLIAGNWKMNMTPTEGSAWAKKIAAALSGDSEVVVCPPYTNLYPVVESLRDTHVSVGAQNVHQEEKGAYTGEVSVHMLKDLGVKYCIIGHSERRQYFSETDELVNIKTKLALSAGLVPIICVGENLSQREQNVTTEWVRYQTKLALSGLSDDQVSGLVIAYEPIWAIGTGKTATSEQAQAACCDIRQVVEEIYNNEVAQNIRILYGGSVTAANASELFSMADIDGGLVGGASLKDDFLEIIKA